MLRPNGCVSDWNNVIAVSCTWSHLSPPWLYMAQRPRAHCCKCQSRSSSFRYSLSSSVLSTLSLLILPLLLFHPPLQTPPPKHNTLKDDSPLGVWASNCICSCEETCEVLQTVFSKCQLKTDAWESVQLRCVFERQILSDSTSSRMHRHIFLNKIYWTDHKTSTDNSNLALRSEKKNSLRSIPCITFRYVHKHEKLNIFGYWS